MKIAKYLPLLLLCLLTACGEPSKSTLLSEIGNTNLSDVARSGNKDDSSSLDSALSSARSSLSSTIIALKDGRAVEQYQLNDALVAASILGTKTVAKFLIEKGANVNARGREEVPGLTPLVAAATNKNGADVAKLLIEHGADVNARSVDIDNLNFAPIHTVASHNNAAVAKVLIEHGANVNLKAKDGLTPLYITALKNSAAVAKLLIEHGADVNAKGESGETPLYWTMLSTTNSVAVAKVMLEHGANVDTKNRNGYTPLVFAILNNRAAIAKLLVEHGADVNAKDKRGETPLYVAVQNDSAKAATFLIEHGADVNVKNNSGWTPLQVALASGKSSVAKVLKEHGAEAPTPSGSTRDRDGFGTREVPTSSERAERTTTSSNSSRGKYGFGTRDAPTHSEKLVDKKTASSSNNRYSQEEDSEDEDEDIEIPSEYEEWCEIIKNDHSEDLIDIIHALEAGLDPCAVRDDGSGHTILHNVVWEDKRLPVIKMLLDNGADPNAVRTDGSSVLRLCIAKGRDDAEIANILCDYGADVNYKDKDGKTLLDLAVAKNKPKTGRILVSYGAKCTRRHKNMDTPTWKDILNRPQTRKPKNAGLAKKPKNSASQKRVTTDSVRTEVPVPGFGSKIRRNNALEGTLFDLKHTNRGVELATGAGNNAGKRKEQLHKAIGILDNGWRVELLKKEYAVAPTQRYTTSIFIADERGGALDANKATAAFDSPFLAPGWLCYYEGYFSVPEAGEYRFVGMGDDAMIVGVDRKTVLYAFWPGEGHGRCVNYRPGWEPDNFCGSNGTDGRGMAQSSRGHRNMLYKGSWLKLVPNKRYFIQVAFGEAAGGKAGAWLGIQEKDRDSDIDFPLFTLEKVRPDPQLQISETGRYNTSCVFKASQK